MFRLDPGTMDGSEDTNSSTPYLSRVRRIDRHLSRGAWRQSVARRSAMLTFFVVPGLLLNFALLVVAATLLPPKEFGIFYLALVLAQILAAPSAFVGFFVARHVAGIPTSPGDAAVWAGVPQLARSIARPVAAGGIVAAAALAVWALGFASAGLALPVAIAAVAATTYLVEIARGVLSGLQRFIALGALGLFWMGGRFLLGIGLLLATGLVWGGVTGVALANALAFSLILVAAWSKRRENSAATVDLRYPISGERVVHFAVSYSLAFAFAYLDTVVGYLVLDKDAYGIYAASSVIPKGIFTLTMPIVQVMFPALGGSPTRANATALMTRSLFLIVAVTVSAGLVAYLIRDALCGGELSIGACSRGLLGVMLASVPLVALLRGIVLAQLATDHDRIALVLGLPALIFLGWGLTARPDMTGLAWGFLYLAAATVGLYGALSLARAGSGRRKAGSA